MSEEENLAEKLKTVKERVEYLLERYPESRNDDFYLYILYVRHFEPELPIHRIHTIRDNQAINQIRDHKKMQAENPRRRPIPTNRPQGSKKAEKARKTLPEGDASDMRSRLRLKDELDLIWFKLDDLKAVLEKTEADLKAAKYTIDYILQRIEKLRSRYKPKHVTPVTTKEAENK